MRPTTRAWVDRLLHDFKPDGATAYTDFVGAATLADDYKHHPHNSLLKVVHKWDKWHFVDYQRSQAPAYVIAGQSPDSTVVTAIKGLVGQLKGHAPLVAGKDDAWALAMLIHFVGDVHQPLHGIDDHDTGGNGFALLWQSSPNHTTQTNLHAFWDDVATLNFKIKSNPTRAIIGQAADGVMAAFPKPSTGLGFAPEAWSHQSFDYGVEYGYGGAVENQVQTAAYLTAWKRRGYERLALAGYRLAALLDALAPS